MADESEFLEAAFSIGTQICREAIWWEDRCNWLGDRHSDSSRSTHKTITTNLSGDLYGGTAGMALFLAHLASTSGESWMKECAEGAANHACTSTVAENCLRTGLFNGEIGRAFGLFEAGRVLGAEQYVAAGEQILRDVISANADQIEDDVLDVIGGAGGGLLALLTLRKRFGLTFLDEICSRLGRHLVESATRSDRGWCWRPSKRESNPGLTGFAHGVSGVIAALDRLNRVLPDPDYVCAIENGLQYERSWFLPDQHNWPDLRKVDESDSKESLPTMMAWCHGAPGIGLARLQLMSGNEDERIAAEASVALDRTGEKIRENLDAGKGNYCLCHGFAGNADILLSAASLLDNEDYLTLARNVGTSGWERYGDNRPSWPNGIKGSGYTPNLMLGIAGTGYFYLRLRDPKEMPSILLPGLDDSFSART